MCHVLPSAKTKGLIPFEGGAGEADWGAGKRGFLKITKDTEQYPGILHIKFVKWDGDLKEPCARSSVTLLHVIVTMEVDAAAQRAEQ